MNSPGYMTLGDDLESSIKVTKLLENELLSPPFADISEPNPKIEIIKKHFGIEVDQICGMDYNFDELTNKKYRTIFCFEVIEHLQNPLLFMKNVKSMLLDGGVIYLTSPGRPRLIWAIFHYNELSPKRFEKWILEPLELRIERKKFIPLKFFFELRYLWGVRPVIKSILLFIFQGTYFYKIV